MSRLDISKSFMGMLRETSIAYFFNIGDLIAGFMTVEKPKPEPDMILYTLEKLGVEPDMTVFVDDTGVGLLAGIRAKVHTIGITTGNNTLEQLQSVNPSTVIDRMSALSGILD